ncbi:hypothetical protein LguiA_033360 [Lonicera macranthoides]
MASPSTSIDLAPADLVDPATLDLSPTSWGPPELLLQLGGPFGFDLGSNQGYMEKIHE